MITLTLSNKKTPEMSNGSFSGLHLLERPLWSLVRAVLMSVTIAVTRGHVDVPDPCCGWESFLCSGIDGCRFIAENG